MLMNILRILVNNLFKENLWKKKINVLTSFFIFHKVVSKLS